MGRISKRTKLKLTDEEKEYLIKLSHSRSQLASVVTRAEILLLSFEGKTILKYRKNYALLTKL